MSEQKAGPLVDDTWLYKLYDASWRMGYATATKHEADFQQAYNDKNVAVTEMETELESYRRQLAELTAERDNWRESFHNMTIIAKRQLDDLEELERENTTLTQRLAEAIPADVADIIEDALKDKLDDIVMHDDGYSNKYPNGGITYKEVESAIEWIDSRRPQAQDSTTEQEKQEVEG